MKQILLFSILCLIAIPIYAIDIPTGNVSGTWNIEDSPYNVQGNITVLNGETLYIEPGVDIIFQGHYSFFILGCLLAEGEEDNFIDFTFSDTTGFTNYNSDDGAWKGFRFLQTYVANDTSKFSYCKVQYTKNRTGGKGAWEIRGYSKISIENCIIKNNWSQSNSAMYALESDLIFRRNIVSNNFGGIQLSDCNALVEFNIFQDNFGFDDLTCTEDCISLYGATRTIVNCNTIINNSFLNGISTFFQSNAIISNNLIADNSGTPGSGIHIMWDSTDIVANNTIVNNESNFGGGIYCSDSTTRFYNNIIWGNNSAGGGDQVFIMSLSLDSQPYFYNNNIQGGLENIGSGGDYDFAGTYSSNLNHDPMFTSDDSLEYSIGSESPCVNTGSSSVFGSYLSDYDLAGNPRVLHNLIDIGAYEFQGEVFLTQFPEFDPPSGVFHEPIQISLSSQTENALIYYTLDESEPSNSSTLYEEPITITESTVIKAIAYHDGLSPSVVVIGTYSIVGETIIVDAAGNGDFATIQDGVNAALDGSEIIVKDGTYTGTGNRNINWNGNSKHMVVRSENGYENCIINLEGSGSAFYLNDTNQNGSDLIQGFTIMNARYSAIRCLSASPTIKDNLLKENQSTSGGGIVLSDSYAIVDGNIIRNNHVTPEIWPGHSYGGGIYIHQGLPIVKNSVISYNTSVGGSIETSGSAGGIFIAESNAIIQNNIVSNNAAENFIGGIQVSTFLSQANHPTITNNLVMNNGGVGIYAGTHSNVMNNNCVSNGAGITAHADFIGEIKNNNSWDNDTNFQTEISGLGNTSWGTNLNGTDCDEFYNISENPIFYATDAGDYFLSQVASGQSIDSPCVNAGLGVPENYTLTEYTTRSDLEWDVDEIDMGFHYHAIVHVGNENDDIPEISQCKLYNYPNPFNPVTTISFSTEQYGQGVEIEIYNVKGQKVKSFPAISNGAINGGVERSHTGNEFSVTWNGTDSSNNPVSSGIYVYTLKQNNLVLASSKMLLIK